VPIAVAEEREDESAQAGIARNVTVDAAQSAIDFAAWPLLDLIDAKTNMAAFFRSGVPAELRLAALRRAWTTDPAIREFKGLSENEWDFDDPNSMPGFGDLGPEVDVPTMVAGILGIPTSVAALSRTKPYDPASSSSFADAIQRVVFGTVHN
jgi:hypothetical protein